MKFFVLCKVEVLSLLLINIIFMIDIGKDDNTHKQTKDLLALYASFIEYEI